MLIFYVLKNDRKFKAKTIAITVVGRAVTLDRAIKKRTNTNNEAIKKIESDSNYFAILIVLLEQKFYLFFMDLERN